MKNVLKYASYLLLYPVVVIFYALTWWSEYVDGVDGKSGQPYYKHKIVNGKAYSKRKGLKHIFKPWWEVKNTGGIFDITVNSMYPSIIK